MKNSIGSAVRLTAFVVGVLLFLQTPVFAKIYKWRDDKGKIHFTNDVTKIPKKYRDQSRVKEFKGIAEEKKTSSINPKLRKEKEEAAVDDKAVAQEADVETMVRTITFLEGEVARDNKYKDNMPTIQNGRALRQAVMGGIPAKEQVVSELEDSEDDVLKEAHGFISGSLKKDQGMPNFIRQQQVAVAMTRIRGEVEGKTKLIKKIKKAIKAAAKK